MSIIHGLRFRLRALLQRSRMDAEISDELAFHIDADIAEQVRRGVPEEVARRETLRRFGGVARTRDEVREAQGLRMWDALAQHAAHTGRMLRHAPGYALMIVVTLGLGIGANSAMFGIVDRLLLHGPRGVVSADALRRVYLKKRNSADGEQVTAAQGYVLYTLLRDQATAFEGVAGYSEGDIRVGRGVDAHKVPVGWATAGFFPLLGARPYLGRFFSVEEDQPPTGVPVVVLGYGAWLREFGADSGVIGRRVTFGSQTVTVVGVAPPGFTGVERKPVDAWFPMSTATAPVKDWPTSWFASWLDVIVRMRPGVSIRSADQQITAALRAGYTGNDPDMRTATLDLRPISFDETGHAPPELNVARLLYGVALLVLLIAAANVAHLMLARTAERRRELSVRIALGAGRVRLARMLLVEALSLAFLGGALGVFLAYWGGTIIRRSLLPSVAWDGPPVDARVLAYTILTAFVTAMLIGVLPAAQATRDDPFALLRSGVPQAGDRHRRIRTILHVAEVALSVVLLFVAGLFVRSLYRVRHVDLGFEPDRVLVANIALADAADMPKDMTARMAWQRERLRRVLADVSRDPSVERASLAIGLPFISSMMVGHQIPGRATLPMAKGGGPWIHAVSPGYFETMGTPVRRGRLFNSGDHEGSGPVVIVNETMARSYWPGEDPLTKCLVVQGSSVCRPVVGVVADAVQWKLREDAPMQYYVPLGQESGIGGLALLVRPHGDAAAYASTLRSGLSRTAPNARFVEVTTLESKLDPQTRPWRVGATLFGLFGVLALIVAAAGLFSVLSYLVSQRRHELGVRLALGALPRDVIGLVLRGALRMSIAGIVIGGAVCFAAAPLLQPMLFETSGRDVPTLAVVAVVLLAAALIAALMPSWRAARVDPLIALRQD